MVDTSATLSQAFEFRAVTNDTRADGPTDFKGPNDFFDTNGRVQFLTDYAQFARTFFANQAWDKPAVSEETVRKNLGDIKAQPVPSVRRRISLNEGWRWLGYRDGQEEEERRALKAWSSPELARVETGSLVFSCNHTYTKNLAEQSWRFFLEWTVTPPHRSSALFRLGTVACVGLNENGTFFYMSGGRKRTCGSYKADTPVTCKIEADLESQRYNFYAGDALLADFVPTLSAKPVTSWIIENAKDLVLHHVWGVGYVKTPQTNDAQWREVPFSIDTFIDEDFQVRPSPQGWTSIGYNDQQWKQTSLPFAHGGERFRHENLYLRKIVRIESFERATLNIEQVYPRAEIWLNNRLVDFRNDNQPAQIDITNDLHAGQDNLIAIRVHANKLRGRMRHTASDKFTGWFAGRAFVDLKSPFYIHDLFAHTTSLSQTSAIVKVRIEVKHELWGMPIDDVDEAVDSVAAHGRLRVSMRHWFPQETHEPEAEATIEIRDLNLCETGIFEATLQLDQPALWTPDHPHLYAVHAELLDEQGQLVDDEVVTTGLRTISQDGGVFKLNGEPAMMNGALVFAMRPPLSDLARTQYCASDDWIMKDLLMIKRLNGNTARMSVHDSLTGFCNDLRYCEMADQIGLLFQWQTGTWVRSASPWQLDFEALPKYVRQVRNHPSIAMWQPANHPKFERIDEKRIWGQRVFDTIFAVDPSRLIAVTASITRMGTPDDLGKKLPGNKTIGKGDAWEFWRHPMLARGGMDTPTGYGNTWDVLREWGGATTRRINESNWCNTVFLPSYLGSKTHAYFNFENEESVGQPNWNLQKGKPYYKFMSYEINYDQGSIGRRLQTDEWETSQAWQAFSAFEAVRWQRCLGYDGFAWCCLRGGGNTATYQKPLLDYEGNTKMAFHALAMAYQPLLAGSSDVDVVYGPADKVHPVILSVGQARTVDLHIAVKRPDGTLVCNKRYPGIKIPVGKSRIDLPSWDPPIREEGHLAFVYTVAKGD